MCATGSGVISSSAWLTAVTSDKAMEPTGVWKPEDAILSCIGGFYKIVALQLVIFSARGRDAATAV